MTGSPMPWVKLYTEILDDHKFGTLSDSHKWRFTELLLLAGECDADGYLANGDEPMDVDAIAWRLRRPVADVEADLELFIQRGFITCEDGIWLVTNFAKRQGRPQHEKQAIWRERKQRQKQREAQEQPEPMPEAPPPEELEEMGDEIHAGIQGESRDVPAPREEKRREDKIVPIGTAREPGEEKPSGRGFTEGQKFWLQAFNAKRFANTTQRDAVLALEVAHGTEAFCAGVRWAAKQGMGMGKALTSLETALPKWNRPKAPPSNGNPPQVTVKGL